MVQNHYSDLNPTLGPVNGPAYTGIMVSLPLTENSLKLFASQVNLEAGQSVTQNMRALDQLDLNAMSSTPISRQNFSDSRVLNVTGSTIPIEQHAYGAELLIDNLYSVNTKENIMTNCVKLLADWESRLTETLLANMLRNAGEKYTFSKGGAAKNTMEANMADLLEMKSTLDQNRVERAVDAMIVATDQIGTTPRGKYFACHVSTGGRKAWEILALSLDNYDTNVARPYQLAGATDYLYQMVFYARGADTALFSSTELHDSPIQRVALMHGHEAYVMTGATPMTSSIVFRPEYQLDSFGMVSSVANRRVLGMSVTRNERIINASYID